MRRHLQQQTETRLDALKQLIDVQLGAPALAGRLRVYSAADANTKAEIDSEMVSMTFVAKFLKDDGWDVDDVHTEGRGYDLDARRHSQIRHVEVKGVAQSAASAGIRMTGNEVLIATQQRKDYWLYVVDNCDNGVGRLFGVYEDPATLFATSMTGDAIFRVAGSTLKNAPGSQQ